MREHDVAYIAGVLDSDGYVTIHKNVAYANPIYSPRVGINQVESQAITLAYGLFGGSLKMVEYELQDRFSRRSMGAWILGSNGLIETLHELIPFMRIKKEQARIALALQENIREWKKFKAIKGHSGSSVYPKEVYEFREECYNNLRKTRYTPVAETKSEGATSLDAGDAIVRTPTIEKLETPTEMIGAQAEV